MLAGFPTFNLGLAAGKPSCGGETDDVESTDTEDHVDSENSVEDKATDAKTMLEELDAIAVKAGIEPVAAPITPISMPPVPAVPNIPVNPFLRRK